LEKTEIAIAIVVLIDGALPNSNQKKAFQYIEVNNLLLIII